MIQNPHYVHSSRSDIPRSHNRDGIQSSRLITNLQQEAVEDITANIMAILESRIRTVLDETAPQIKVAVRQALSDRDRALSRSYSYLAASTHIGATPPAVGDDMSQTSIVPKKTSLGESASRAKKIAVASPKPQLSARHHQLAGSLTQQERTRRRYESSTTTNSSSEIDVQSSRSLSMVKMEEDSDEECFCRHNSVEDDTSIELEMKETPESDDEDSSSDDEGSSSDSDYIGVADDVDNAVSERSAGSTRTANTPARALRSLTESGRGSLSGMRVNPSQHRQPARSSPSTASHVGRSSRDSRTAARTCDLSSGSSRKRTREDQEPEFLYPREDPLRKEKLVEKGKVLGFR